MELSKISFPIYRLGQFKPFEMDGVVFFINQYDKDKQEVTTIVDDKNMFGESLAIRRLGLLKEKVRLFKLRVAIFFLADLIKIAKSSKYWFIDSTGKTFQYKKSRIVNLVFKRIERVTAIPTGGSIVQVVGLEQRFKSMLKIGDKYKYVGLLELNSKSYLLYGIYEDRLSDTKRKI